MAEHASPRIAIIGSGFSGLCLGIRLRQSGIDSFTILEKSARLGGTWRENTYPGAACDIPSMLYCFSFEQKSDWSRMWSPQPEILSYLEHCAEKYGLIPHLRLGTEVVSASFDSEAGLWKIRTRSSDDGSFEDIEAEVLVSGVGQLHKPLCPKIPGLDAFEGEWFHSAEWRHDVELAGKRVGVVGNGASAVQFVPEIAPETERLCVFQRSANWMVPRGDRPYSDAERERFARHPRLTRLYRWFIWARQELMYAVMIGKPWITKRWTAMALDNMRSHISDPEMRRALTPDYPIGGKRILIHDTYYPALARDNVELESSTIERIEGRSVVTRDGTRREIDVLIFATGFDTHSFLSPISVEGLEGRRLEKEWGQGAEAYLGLSVTGFPNFFMMYGPNTNLGHNSIVFMIECQANYILKCLERLSQREIAYLDLRPEVLRDFNQTLHRELADTAWAKASNSWYKTEAGKITNNWSGTTTRYWWRTRQPDFSAYREVAR